MRDFCLPSLKERGYSASVAAKSAIGRGNPFYKLSATQTPSASFFVSYHRAYHNCGSTRTVSMVALVGQPSGWPVSDNAGISTPASVTTPLERGNSGGDSLTLLSEIAIMATIPTSPHPEFTFIFLAVRRADQHDRPHRESITAPDELTARRMLAREFVLLFAGRVPAREVSA